MLRKTVYILMMFALVPMLSVSSAQEAGGISAEEMVFATAVEDREPVGTGASFPASVEKIYCFSRIAGVTEPTTITHVWFFNDNEMARVDLTVNGSPWRTWSSKTMLPEWAGTWRVDIVSPSGDLLSSLEFILGGSSE